MKEMQNYSFGRTDLYLVFLMKAKGGELKPQESEQILSAQWYDPADATDPKKNQGMILKMFAPALGVSGEEVKKQISEKLFTDPAEFMGLTSLTPHTYEFYGREHTLFINQLT